MSGAPLDHATLLTLFEAARWAPSSGNNQPWRFVYAHRETPAFDTLFGLLNEGNRAWCIRAAVLLVTVSRNVTDTGKHNRTHSFDAGAAWGSLALQGTRLGLVVHGMGGFDYDLARTELGVPDDHTVECMIAIGHRGRVEDLPEHQKPREKPSSRKPVESFTFEGRFGE